MTSTNLTAALHSLGYVVVSAYRTPCGTGMASKVVVSNGARELAAVGATHAEALQAALDRAS
jgi:ornithine cyclodeaminase/alanine dehydrogenase-like protein (mu-crystallin family)